MVMEVICYKAQEWVGNEEIGCTFGWEGAIRLHSEQCAHILIIASVMPGQKEEVHLCDAFVSQMQVLENLVA